MRSLHQQTHWRAASKGGGLNDSTKTFHYEQLVLKSLIPMLVCRRRLDNALIHDQLSAVTAYPWNVRPQIVSALTFPALASNEQL